MVVPNVESDMNNCEICRIEVHTALSGCSKFLCIPCAEIAYQHPAVQAVSKLGLPGMYRQYGATGYNGDSPLDKAVLDILQSRKNGNCPQCGKKHL
jgi:hypothetical protein